jgi:hypothetical protein
MGIAEIRAGFDSYTRGVLTEFELRSAIRHAVQVETQAAPVYMQMAANLRQRQLISADLEAAVAADIATVVAHTNSAASNDSGDERTPWLSSPEETLLRPSRSDNFDRYPSLGLDADDAAIEVPPSHPGFRHPMPPAGTVSTGPRTGTGTGSAWDTPEKLAEPEADIRIGSLLKGRYELVEQLGKGGMGVVYKAVDRLTEIDFEDRDSFVAVKVLTEEFKRHPDAMRSLQREAKKTMGLSHPNIVSVRHFDRDQGNVYMVMETLGQAAAKPLSQGHAVQHGIRDSPWPGPRLGIRTYTGDCSFRLQAQQLLPDGPRCHQSTGLRRGTRSACLGQARRKDVVRREQAQCGVSPLREHRVVDSSASRSTG